MDRRAIAVAVAKTIAYVNCNKPLVAEDWFKTLAMELGMTHMIKPTPVVDAPVVDPPKNNNKKSA